VTGTSSNSPGLTRPLESAISSLRARATIIVLRVPRRLSAVGAWYHSASALDTISGAGTAQGIRAWSDIDNDKIFTSYSRKISTSGAFDGMNKITGGTGKFNGIQGQAPFHCRFLNDQSQAI
jgi:hypothetical protein